VVPPGRGIISPNALDERTVRTRDMMNDVRWRLPSFRSRGSGFQPRRAAGQRDRVRRGSYAVRTAIWGACFWLEAPDRISRTTYLVAASVSLVAFPGRSREMGTH